MAILHGNEQKINDALLWKEIIGSDTQKAKRKAFLQELMDSSEKRKTNELVEQIKAVCKARDY